MFDYLKRSHMTEDSPIHEGPFRFVNRDVSNGVATPTPPSSGSHRVVWGCNGVLGSRLSYCVLRTCRRPNGNKGLEFGPYTPPTS